MDAGEEGNGCAIGASDVARARAVRLEFRAAWARWRFLYSATAWASSDPDRTGVGADKILIKDSAGKLIELLFLDGDQEAGADLGGQGYFVQRDFALLPLPL